MILDSKCQMIVDKILFLLALYIQIKYVKKLLGIHNNNHSAKKQYSYPGILPFKTNMETKLVNSRILIISLYGNN
jgi:hypothetical protein